MSRTVAVAQLGYFIGHAQHTTGLFVMLGLCVSHGGCSTTGLFHSSTQLGYFMKLTTGLFCHAGFESHTVA